jgi:hypothetical protein
MVIFVLTVEQNNEAYELLHSLQRVYLQAPSTSSCKHGKALLESVCQALVEDVTKA